MTGPEKRILEARLLVSRPEEAFDELRRYAAAAKRGGGTGDESLEKALLGRDDPLTDLALAQFATDPTVVSFVYTKALTAGPERLPAYWKGVRVACLSNEVVGLREPAKPFPDVVIGEEATDLLIEHGDEDELEALFSNPHISDTLLEGLYARKEPFERMSEERWLHLIHFTRTNSRLVSSREDDLGPDLGHRAIHEAIFTALEIAPQKPAFIDVLYDLIERLNPSHVHHPDGLEHVLKRWAAGIAQTGQEPPEGYYTSLSLLDELRCLIAAQYGGLFRDGNIVPYGNPQAADIAVRCAFYGNAHLNTAQMQAGFERDRNVFVFAALFNNHVFLRPELRRLLEENLSRVFAELYARRSEQVHARWPSFNPEPVTPWLASLVRKENGEPKPRELPRPPTVSVDTTGPLFVHQLGRVRQLILWIFFALTILILLTRIL
jgi:hypothetical protein